MILQIRTKDNLEELLKQGNSPAWVIAESRVPEIQSVEIYQFDGKRVLKAEFDAANSTRTESDRLVVAFKNGVIEDADMDWNGQNPVRYKSSEVSKDSTGNKTVSSEAENGKQDDESTTLLKKINEAFIANSNDLYNLLISACDNSDITSKIPCIYVEWFSRGNEHPLDYRLTINKTLLNNLLLTVDSDLANKIKKIEIPENEEIVLRTLLHIVELCQESSYTVLAAIFPTEWRHCFFVYKNIDEITPWLLLHQFDESYDSGLNDKESFLEDGINYEILSNNFNQWLSHEYKYIEEFYNDNKKLKYEIREEPVQDIYGNKIGVRNEFYYNLEILNLNESIYEIFKKAVILAKQFYFKPE